MTRWKMNRIADGVVRWSQAKDEKTQRHIIAGYVEGRASQINMTELYPVLEVDTQRRLEKRTWVRQ